MRTTSMSSSLATSARPPPHPPHTRPHSSRHSYERSLPVYRGQPTSSSNASYTSPAAPIYIVNGAAGNREGNSGPPPCIKGVFPWCARGQGAQSGVIG